ncbi:MAG: hypothetical protein KA712_11110 [Myxococcales bacterium]|nr:hypothetical protein [Myxococcales bacterium]
MSTGIIVVLAIAVAGSALYLSRQIREVRLARRNRRHWENDEPLEGGVDKWD